MQRKCLPLLHPRESQVVNNIANEAGDDAQQRSQGSMTSHGAESISAYTTFSANAGEPLSTKNSDSQVNTVFGKANFAFELPTRQRSVSRKSTHTFSFLSRIPRPPPQAYVVLHPHIIVWPTDPFLIGGQRDGHVSRRKSQ